MPLYEAKIASEKEHYSININLIIEESFYIIIAADYLQKDDHIENHFITCFISMLAYKLSETTLGENFTCHKPVSGLKNMNFLEISGKGYIPTYTRTGFTDTLHDTFRFCTDYQNVSNNQMKYF